MQMPRYHEIGSLFTKIINNVQVHISNRMDTLIQGDLQGI